MRTLVIAPHCDDAEFGCGGYIARIGKKAHIAVVGASSIHMADKTFVSRETRVNEQIEAARVLGCNILDIGHTKENRFPDELYYIISLVEGWLRDFEPEQLLFPLPSFNQDHDTVHKAVVTALRPNKPRPYLHRAMAYEYPMNCWGPQVPNTGKVYVPLTTSELEAKIMALECHDSQVRYKLLAGYPGVETLASMRGVECNCHRAELYYLFREIIPIT